MIAYLLATAVALATAAHDFHVSRLTVNHDTQGDRLELTLQTYVDDLEGALVSAFSLDTRPQGTLPCGDDVNLLDPGQHPSVDSLVEVYLRRRLSLEDDRDTPLAWRFVGMERAEDPYAMFVYLALEGPGVERTTKLRSSFLVERFPDQQNVVIWQRDGEARDYDLLTARERACRWSR